MCHLFRNQISFIRDKDPSIPLEYQIIQLKENTFFYVRNHCFAGSPVSCCISDLTGPFFYDFVVKRNKNTQDFSQVLLKQKPAFKTFYCRLYRAPHFFTAATGEFLEKFTFLKYLEMNI